MTGRSDPNDHRGSLLFVNGLPMSSNSSRRPQLTLSRSLLMMSAAMLLVGCEQMKSPDYYSMPRENTTTDAIRQAETGGTRQVVQAPSQIQLKINRTGAPQSASEQGATGQPATGQSAERLTTQGRQAMAAADTEIVDLGQWVPNPQTYFGTLPCFHKDMRCTSQRVTLTLAPNGRWRARAEYLENQAQSGKPLADQGCWRVTPTTPATLILLDPNGNARAEMVFQTRNNLRVRTVNGETPNLTYTLTRQPDMDPIAELNNTTAPSCN